MKMNNITRYFVAGISGAITFLVLSVLWATFVLADLPPQGPFAECFSTKELLQHHVTENGMTDHGLNEEGKEVPNLYLTIEDPKQVQAVLNHLSEQMGPPPKEYGIENVNKLGFIAAFNGSGMLIFYADDCSHNRAIRMPTIAFGAILGHIEQNGPISKFDVKFEPLKELFDRYEIKSETY
jgi:hypothetical protein